MVVTASASQMLRKTIYWLAFGFIRLSLRVWAPTFLIAYRQTLTRSSFMRVFMPTAMVFTVVLEAVSPTLFTTLFKVMRSL